MAMLLQRECSVGLRGDSASHACVLGTNNAVKSVLVEGTKAVIFFFLYAVIV